MTKTFLPRLSILAGVLLTLTPGCGSDSGGETGPTSSGLTETDTAATGDDTAGTEETTGTTGDAGDGDAGDGDAGDGDAGDGDAGDGDAGDGDAGDGDGDTGDGDGDTGDGDGDTGDGDGDTGDGDGDGDGDTGEEPCTSDEDCPEGDICNEATGECQTNCGTAMVQLANPPPPVMLVLDKSGSMVSVNNVWDHDNDPGTDDQTRWETLYNVTDFLLTNFESSISFGLQLFPSTSATVVCANEPECLACDVGSAPEVGIAIENRTAILNAMPPANATSSTVAGATPAAGGMVNAKAALDTAIANGEEGAAFILITDGAANCGLQWANEPCVFPGDGTSASCELMDYFDDQLQPLIEGYYTDDGIPTYVVGIDIQDEVLDPLSEYNFRVDNTNVYTELNAIAVAGGVPQAGPESFYNATNEAELQAAFEAIAGELATCDIDLSEAPNTPPLPAQIPYVEFSMMNMTVPGPLSISEAECDMGVENGWIWVVEGISVRFCGTFCDTLLSEGEVDGIYGCPMGG